MYNCEKCERIFDSKKKLNGHQKAHRENKNDAILKCSCIITRKVLPVYNLEKYQKQLVQCQRQGCTKVFKPKHTALGLYCSHSCATKINNLKRGSKTDAQKDKISKTLLLRHANKINDIQRVENIKNGNLRRGSSKPKVIVTKKLKKVKEVKGYYVFKCMHCMTKFKTIRRKRYCSECECLYMANNRNRFKFTFNIYKYPDLFDLELLDEVGFFAPGGRAGKWNLDGLSRDHKISVNEAIKNNYDPFYIKHPLNCALIPHKENNKKHTTSSIKYSELVQQVDMFEKLALPEGFEPPSHI